VYSGLLDKLDWRKYAKESSPSNIEIPPVSLTQLINTLKNKLNIKYVRYIGDDNQVCKKILLMPGAAGGERQITSLGQSNPDVAIVGELQEWETAEYVRDARAAGKKLALIILGHTDSEDAGSIYMKEWLIKNVPGIKATHIHSGNPLNFK
jgi:putative NIF3 family GTP cyclohydrolase 1 type 2